MPAALSALLFAVAYFVLGRVGYLLVDHPGGSALFWPPNGLYLAVLLLAPRRRWPLLIASGAVASTAASLLYGRPLAMALFYFLGNSLEALAGALLVPAVAAGRPRIGTVRGVLSLLLVPALIGLVVSALVRLVTIAWSGGAFGPSYWVWWAGSALGVSIVAPTLLAWTDPRERLQLRPLRRRLELAAVVAAYAGAVALLATSRPGAFYATELVLVPPMLWAAIRFGPRAASLSVLAMSLAVVTSAAGGRGLLARATPEPGAEVLSLQFFLGLLTATALVAAAVAAEGQVSRGRRARAEALLREALRAARLWRFASQKATDATLMVREDGRVLYANEAFGRLVGRAPAELAGLPAWEVSDRGDEDRWRAWFDEVARGGRAVREQWIPVAGGEPVPHEVIATHLRTGGRSYLVQSMRDLSDRRKAEEAARLAGVGTLAAGVAHEINNPLAWVSGNLELVGLALDRLGQAPADAAAVAAEARRALADATAGAGRVRDIVRDLKIFSREEEGVGPVDVRRAAQSALAIARNELRHRARVVTRLDAEVPPVIANERRLGQVFLNLLLNAAQAIPAGRAEGHQVVVEAYAAGGEVAVEVGDSGAGMSPQVKARIFEPFFTTKPLGEGTGLGLSIGLGIVTALGGRIEVESREGQGSTFRVVLPAAPPAVAAPASPPSEALAPAPLGRLRILVVDDEPLVGMLVGRLLEGQEITAVLRASEALERAGRGERWDVILCDLMMPDLTGMELHARLHAAHPALAARMIFVTGGAFTPEASEFLDRFEGRRLDKPFTSQALRAAVAKLHARLGPA